jgi:hypothetical protein
MLQTILRRRPPTGVGTPGGEKIRYQSVVEKKLIEGEWCTVCDKKLGSGRCERCVAYDVMES